MAIASFEKEWQTIKTNFERATAKKKPSEKFMGLFNKSSGMTPASRKLDQAIANEDKAEADKALADFDRVGSAYQQVLGKAAAAETDKTVIAETKVMIGEITGLQKEAETTVEKVGAVKRVGTLAQWAAQMKNKALGARITDYAKRTHNDDLLLFLGTMVKKDYSTKTYDTFVKPGSKYEINIDDTLRSKFDPANLRAAPWGDATSVVIDLFNNNIINKLM